MLGLPGLGAGTVRLVLAGTWSQGIPGAKTMCFYEQAGLLPAPPRTPGGYRGYPPQTSTRLAFVREVQPAGLTLAEIRSVLTLRDSGQAPCAHVMDRRSSRPSRRC